MTVLVERVTPQPSARYGTVHRCELLDADANVLAWWHTRGTSRRVGEGRRSAWTCRALHPLRPTAVTVLNHCRREALGSGNFPADIRHPLADRLLERRGEETRCRRV